MADINTLSSERLSDYYTIQNETIRNSIARSIFSSTRWLLADKKQILSSLDALPNDDGNKTFIEALLSRIYFMELKMEILFTLAGLSTLLLLVFVVFVGFYEVSAPKSNAWISVATPFNILSFIGIASSIGYNLLEGFACRAEFDDMMNRKLRFGANVLETVWAISYLSFSWIRAEKQIQTIFPKTFRILRIFFATSPFVIALPAIFSMAHLFFSSDSNSNLFLRLLTGSQITAAATFIFLDSIFLFCFIKYLTHTQVDDDSPIDPRFLIISRYGCLASTLCLLLLACSIAYNITDLVFGGVGSSLALVVLGMASGICATMVFLVLFCMKVALWWQSGKELELAKARLKKAKMESDATIFVN